MPGLILPQRFTRQPQYAAAINRDVPAAYGLAHAWGLNVRGSLTAYDAAGKAHGVFGTQTTGTSSGNTWRIVPGGYYLNFDDGGTGTEYSAVLLVGDGNGSGGPAGTAFSIQARINLGAIGSGATIYGCTNGGLQLTCSGGRIILNSRNTVNIGANNTTFGAGVDVDIGVSYDGTNFAAYFNGLPDGSATNSVSLNNVQQFALGAPGYDINERAANGLRIYYLNVWNRVRTAKEFAEHAINPWNIYAAPARRLYAAALTSAIYRRGLYLS